MKARRNPDAEIDREYSTEIIHEYPQNYIAPQFKNLLFAILNRAYLDLVEAAQVVQPGDRRDAYRWIASDSLEPFSFTWVCYHLDVEPEVVRDSLLSKYQDAYN